MTTFSEHVYTARVLDPGGDIVLSVDEDSPGEITLDAAAIPHVQGTLTLAVEDTLLLEDLDPRDSRRVVVDVSATFPTDTRSRSFNLGIRDAMPNRADATVTLRLASDEAILMDYAQLVDDGTPRVHEASLRAVCNYVLGKIGAVLQAGTADSDVTAYWPITNLFTNPSFENTVAGWTNGSLATGLAPTTGQKWVGAYSGHWQTTGTGSSFIDFTGPIRVQAGRPYVFSGYMRATVARAARLMIRFKNAAGVVLADRYSSPVNLSTTAWSRITNVQTAPAGATEATAHVEYQSSAAGQFPYVDGLMFHEGDEVVPYFDGDTADTADYEYAWTGTPQVSTSTRTPTVERSPDALIWRAGVSGMSFLEPLLKAAGLRLVCNEQRQWTLRNAEYRAAGDQIYRYGANIETADESLSREDDAWRDGAVYEYVWTDADGIEQRRVDAFALTATPTKVSHVVIRDTPYPGPGRAEHMVRRAQGRGRTVTVSAIPSWLESTDQTLSVLLEGSPIQTGIAGSVTFNLADDTVTVSSRTTDTPAAAWILIPAGQRWIDSPVGGSWTGEII